MLHTLPDHKNLEAIRFQGFLFSHRPHFSICDWIAELKNAKAVLIRCSRTGNGIQVEASVHRNTLGCISPHNDR